MLTSQWSIRRGRQGLGHSVPGRKRVPRFPDSSARPAQDLSACRGYQHRVAPALEEPELLELPYLGAQPRLRHVAGVGGRLEGPVVRDRGDLLELAEGNHNYKL